METHHRSPTFLIPATTRSLRRQNSTSISANLVGSSYNIRSSLDMNVRNKERTAYRELKARYVLPVSYAQFQAQLPSGICLASGQSLILDQVGLFPRALTVEPHGRREICSKVLWTSLRGEELSSGTCWWTQIRWGTYFANTKLWSEAEWATGMGARQYHRAEWRMG